MFLLVIDFPDQYKTIHCKSTNKNSVYNKLYHIYHNSLENLNQFIYKFIKTFYSVFSNRFNCKNTLKLPLKTHFYFIYFNGGLHCTFNLRFTGNKIINKINSLFKKNKMIRHNLNSHWIIHIPFCITHSIYFS